MLGQGAVHISRLALAIAMVAISPEASVAAAKVVSATIRAVNDDGKSISIVPNGALETIDLVVDSGSRIMLDGKTVGPGILVNGMSATVSFDTSDNRLLSLRARSAGASPAERAMPKPKPRKPAASPAPSRVRPTQARDERPVETPIEQAGDWPQWRGPRQDGISVETGLLSEWPEDGPPELWSVPIGLGFSGVAVVGDRLYTMDVGGGKERILAIDATSGRTIWSQAYDGVYESDQGSGPRSTPTISEDLVYTLGATGVLSCVDADSGKPKWTRNLLAEFKAPNTQYGISSSPLVVGELVFVNPGGQRGNSMAALDKKTGRTRWSIGHDAAGYSTPISFTIGDNPIVAFFTAAGIVGVHPTRGKEVFRFPWMTPFNCNIATPIYSENRLFISSAYGVGCALVLLTPRGDNIFPRSIYTSRNMKNHFSTCILLDGVLYGFSDEILTCMDLGSGNVHWRERGFRKGSMTAAEGNLYLLGEDGTLALARATPDRFDPISRCQPLTGRCWTPPVIAGKRLFLRNESVLKCLDLAPQKRP